MTFIEKLERTYDKNCPIFIEDLVSKYNSYDSLKQELSFCVANNYLKRYSRGIYYFPSKTIVGESVPSFNEVIEKKYITDGKKYYGYYSGAKLLNSVGLSNQVPNILEITTNKETNIKRTVSIRGRQVVLRKPRIEVNKDNYNYLLFLEIIKYAPLDTLIDNKDLIIGLVTIYELDVNKLLVYASKVSRSIRKKIREMKLYDEIA